MTITLKAKSSGQIKLITNKRKYEVDTGWPQKAMRVERWKEEGFQ